ncbi:MAG: D-tyrosyl-tRNA(Tyr) deacylase [Clostridiaceae bacterium]|nr:D-tyrosyl-tRNA(Tyr) deacylase [Clostridiaceae bacterium]
MRAVIQRVKSANVKISQKSIANINQGLLVFLGISQNDSQKDAELLWRKISQMRIFADEEGKTNLNIKAIQGNFLIVSQFTLYANCKKGNRPSFTNAASAELGEKMYEYFLDLAKQEFPQVQHGEFGADMSVEIVNDGPFTIILDTQDL